MHPAPPDEGERFFAERWPAAAAIADPRKELYGAFGIGRGGPLQLVGPAVWRAGWRAMRAGHAAGRPKGDPLQMSGHLLVHDGRVVRTWRHAHAGTPLELDEIARAAAALSTTPAPGAVDRSPR